MRTPRRSLAAPVILLAFVALSSCYFGVSRFPVRAAQRQPRHPAADLHGLATQNGGEFISAFNADRSVPYPNIAELAKRSREIVIGRATGFRDRITTDGTSVTKDTAIEVQEVLKGDIGKRAFILVSLPGGAHAFPDGTMAFVYARNYRRPEVGKTYLLFLNGKHPVARGYALAGGIQGQFELDFSKGTVMPSNVVTHDPLVARHKGQPISALLAELHAALRSNK